MNEKILLVDDEVSILIPWAGALRDEGYRVSWPAPEKKRSRKLQHDMPDVVLLDIWMPGMDGLAVLEQVKAGVAELPVIIISGHGNIETAVRATKLGAFDFVEKPFSLDRILVSIQNALEFQRLQEDNLIWRQKATRRYQMSGRARSLTPSRQQIHRAAPTNATVLITGENGTGQGTGGQGHLIT